MSTTAISTSAATQAAQPPAQPADPEPSTASVVGSDGPPSTAPQQPSGTYDGTTPYASSPSSQVTCKACGYYARP